MPTSHQPITIFSGGSAANSLVDVFTSLAQQKSCPLAYIIPISDNGGSSSELIRVFGGPGIGDVRSRLVRLIPRLPRGSPGAKERQAVKELLSFRLSSEDRSLARNEWNDVVDGTSHLWRDVSSAKKELIRSIFNLVNLEVIKRSRPPGSTFDFTSASVGNLFLTGARLFTGSFESAIYLMSSICGINDDDVKVVPSINSNFSHHIAAGLEDGSVIVGQNAISHPSPVSVAGGERSMALRSDVVPAGSVVAEINGARIADYDERKPSLEHYHGDEEAQLGLEKEQHEEEDAHLPGTLPTLRTKNITFDKNYNAELPARISRIWYINPYGQEMIPPANPRAISAISNAQAVIYSIGSLYTSLAPSLVLRGVGEALRRNTSAAGKPPRIKILILNGSLDREVGPLPPAPGSHGKQFSALDFVDAVVKACEQSRGVIWEASSSDSAQAGSPSTTKATARPSRPGLYPSKSETITTNFASASAATSRSPRLFAPPLLASAAPSQPHSRDQSPPQPLSPALSPATGPSPQFDPVKTNASTGPDQIYSSYVTHIIHLPNSPTVPFVDRDLLQSKCNITCIKAYGRKHSDGSIRYDPAALKGAIEAILGRNPEKSASNVTDDEEEDDASNTQRVSHDHDDSDDKKKRRTDNSDRAPLATRNGMGRRNTVDTY